MDDIPMHMKTMGDGRRTSVRVPDMSGGLENDKLQRSRSASSANVNPLRAKLSLLTRSKSSIGGGSKAKDDKALSYDKIKALKVMADETEDVQKKMQLDSKRKAMERRMSRQSIMSSLANKSKSVLMNELEMRLKLWIKGFFHTKAVAKKNASAKK